jgi:hypothetical protein
MQHTFTLDGASAEFLALPSEIAPLSERPESLRGFGMLLKLVDDPEPAMTLAHLARNVWF